MSIEETGSRGPSRLDPQIAARLKRDDAGLVGEAASRLRLQCIGADEHHRRCSVELPCELDAELDAAAAAALLT